jgi:hypothetical protein
MLLKGLKRIRRLANNRSNDTLKNIPAISPYSSIEMKKGRIMKNKPITLEAFLLSFILFSRKPFFKIAFLEVFNKSINPIKVASAVNVFIYQLV